MKRTTLISRLITNLDALRQRISAGRQKLTGDTWLLVALIFLACISLAIFITYAFLFVRTAAIAAV